jgi:hypothetical protein
MTTPINGLLGGLVVGVVAAVATRLVAGESPATGAVAGNVLGADIASSALVRSAVRTCYGGLAGVALVALELYALGVLAVPPTLAEALGVAVAWSALLFGVVSVGWWVVASRSVARSRLGELFVYHLVYGVGFGLWIRLTWTT